MLILDFIGWIVVVVLFYIGYFILYAMFITEPIDNYLGYGNESMKQNLKRLEGSSKISERLYIKYWARLPIFVNYALVILNIAYVALMLTITIIHFTHINLSIYMYISLGTMFACSAYINFMTVKMDQK